MEVISLNLEQGWAIMCDGTYAMITDIMDDDGEETDDLESAVVVVVQSWDWWHVLTLSEYSDPAYH